MTEVAPFASELTSHFAISVLPSVRRLDLGTVEDLARIGVVTPLLQADLDRFGLTPQWSSLLSSLATLVRLAGKVADVSVPYSASVR